MSDRVSAAVTVGRRLGLRVDEPVVLRDLGSALVHLAPSPVLARAWVTGQRDPAVVEYELAATSYLAACGAPVAAPYDEATHVVGDHTVTVWHRLDHDPQRPLDGSAAGRALRLVHELLDSPAAPDASGLPHFVRLDTARRVVDELEVPDSDRGDLEEMLSLAGAEVSRRSLRLQPLHGDAWLGNVLRTPTGPVWSDFELMCRGPRDADLAANEAVSRDRGRTPADDAFLDGYGEVDLDAVAALTPLALVPFVAWTFRLAGERPDFLPGARSRLATALAGLRGR
jgi:Ser/Thr protein kinase RdoA (MazF antagonist)